MKAPCVFLLAALFALAVPAPAQEYVPTPVTVSKEKIRQNGKLYYSHVVLDRQTLFSISKAYQVTVEEIYEANPALHETGLRKNDILLIPVRSGEAASAEETPRETAAPQETAQQPAYTGPYREHSVRWFETLYAISRKYGVPVEAIMAANGLTSNNIKAGTVLRIPELPAVPETVPETPAATGTETASTPDSTGVKGVVGTLQDLIQDIKDGVGEQIGEWTFQPKEKVEATLLLPFNASGTPNDIHMDFYAGALLAVRDLEKEGISTVLHVYDVATGVLPSQEKLSGSDLVLGPVSAKDLETVLQRTGGRVPVISPLDPKAASLRPAFDNLIQAPSPAESQYADLVEWLESERTREDRVVVLTEKGVENEAGKALVSAMDARSGHYSAFSYSLQEGTSVPTRILEHLARNRTNRILVASDRAQFLSDVLRNVSILLGKGYEIILYTPSKIRTFDIDGTLFHNAQLHLSSAYYVDYNDPSVKQFLLAYRALYNTEPSQFAFQGYDTVSYFVRQASRYGSRWMQKLETEGTEKGLHTDFRFRESQNEASRRVIYKKDYTTARVR